MYYKLVAYTFSKNNIHNAFSKALSTSELNNSEKDLYTERFAIAIERHPRSKFVKDNTTKGYGPLDIIEIFTIALAEVFHRCAVDQFNKNNINTPKVSLNKFLYVQSSCLSHIVKKDELAEQMLNNRSKFILN